MLERLRRGQATETDLLWTHPERIFQATGLNPYPWQQQILQSKWAKIIVLCCRQSGKSLACSALALRTMLVRPGSLVLVVSPSNRQSSEFVLKVKNLFYRLQIKGLPGVISDAQLQFCLDNDSRLIGLPDSEGKVRGYSNVDLLFFEEASRIPDPLHYVCTPMLAASHGRMVALSTAWAKDGWYYDAWKKDPGWQHFNLTAGQCPHFTKEFLASERKSMPERWFAREYQNVFLDPTDSVFREEDIEKLVDPSIRPLLSW